MEIDMGKKNIKSGDQPADGDAEKKTKAEREKEDQRQREAERRAKIIENMRVNGLPVTDEAAINFVESFYYAQDDVYQSFGRPTKYDPKMDEWVVSLGAKGYSLAQIAFLFGVSRDTLYEWGRENGDFSYALTRAREAAQNWWEMIGQASLFSEKFQFGVWNKVVSTRFRKDYTDRKGLPYDPNEPETIMGPGEVLELDPRDLTEEQKKVLRIAIAKATKQES